MSLNEILPLLVLGSSLVPGLIIFFLAETRFHLRTALNLAGAIIKLLFIGYMIWGVMNGQSYYFRHTVLHGLDLALKADALAMLFVSLSGSLWLLTTLYAIGYLEGSPHRSRFFGFFSLCVTATVGIAMAANLFTFFFFYELLTLSTYPLIVHRGSDAAIHGGNTYLAYALTGSAVLLTGVVWLYDLLGYVDFTYGGVLSPLGSEYDNQLRIIFFLIIAGLGVKAAIVPLHGWLPQAMVAPAPVSALLHAVAVVKAGAYGIVRVVYEVYGTELSASLGLLVPLALVACVTIIWGSLRAIWQDNLKRRLAYSTISQISYIILGTAMFGLVGTVGGVVHLVHQGIMKITLFFCAGNYAETLGVHRISGINGAGRRMPWTSAAFSIAALGMMGAPLTAGYVSKSYLSEGAQQANMIWAEWVLTGSAVLNAMYFLPILYRLWCKSPPPTWPREHIQAQGGKETAWLLLIPPLVTAVATIAAGIFSESNWSPLFWVKIIAVEEYSP